jgi:hypothetical protein
MEIESVPPALQARLGPEATGGLLQLLHRSDLERRADVIAACTERFERRLVEEVSGLRIQVGQVESAIRQDMANLRAEIAQQGSTLREEMAVLGSTIRQEMATLGSGLRDESAAGRVDLFKWCFLFWVGQVLAIGGLLAVMLRLTR